MGAGQAPVVRMLRRPSRSKEKKRGVPLLHAVRQSGKRMRGDRIPERDTDC